MSKLVERLRECKPGKMCLVAREAASALEQKDAEIERLTEERNILAASVHQWCEHVMVAERALADANERVEDAFASRDAQMAIATEAITRCRAAERALEKARELHRANFWTMERAAERLKGHGLSTCELDLAVKQTKEALSPAEEKPHDT